MIRLLVVLLCLLFMLPVWADAKILYTRSPSVCANNGNGMGYDCATSVGGVGAFKGTNNILWGSVSSGDIVYICGIHVINTASLRVTPTVSGSSGKPIIISGDCPNDPGVLDGQNSSAGIRLVNLGSSGPITHIIVDKLVFKNVVSNND